MIALIGAFGGFHLPEQCVHFGDAELAASPDCAMAGHRRQQFVATCGKYLADPVFAHFGKQGTRERCRVCRL